MVKPESPPGEASLYSDEEQDMPGPNKKRRLTKDQNFAAVARNLEIFGKDVILGPSLGVDTPTWNFGGGDRLPELPPRHIADRLLSDFHTMLYTAFPMFSWATLMTRHEELYRYGSSPSFSKTWYALYYAVLAVGALRTNKEDGTAFFKVAATHLDLWSDEQSMDAIRATAILAIYQVESNNVSAGYKMFGHAVRAAYDMGLHRRLEQRTVQEDQARLSLWWCVFSCERYALLCLIPSQY